MAQQVKVLIAKTNELSSIPGPHITEIGTDSHKYTLCAMVCTYPQHTHTQTINIKI